MHQQISGLSWFSFGYWKRMFVDSLTEYLGPPNCVQYWVWSSRMWKKFDNAIRTVSSSCLFFGPHLTTHQSNIGVWSRKVTEERPHTLEHAGIMDLHHSLGQHIRVQGGMDGWISSKLLIFDRFASNYQPESPIYCSSFLCWSPLVLHLEIIIYYNQS